MSKKTSKEISKVVLDREQNAQFHELQELVERILHLGQAVRSPLAEILTSQDEEAAWSEIGIIKLNLENGIYENDPQRLLEDLEHTQELLAIVYPTLERVVERLSRECQVLRFYSQELPHR